MTTTIVDAKSYKRLLQELEQHRKQHERLKLLFNVTRNITRELTIDRLLLRIMDEVKNVLNCDRCSVFIMDEENQELWAQVAHGGDEIRFPSHLGIAGYVATTGETLNIPDAYADHRFNPNIDKQTGYRTRNILTIPMRNKMRNIIGVFQALNKFGGPFTRDDEELLDAISAISAGQIENAQLYEEQKKTFDSFIETLATTIDARDPMTAGHSKRIAMYSDEIAQIVKLTDAEREVLRTAALLHDYGKIAVREAVLTKKGRLTPEEFEHIQSHPEFTRRILRKINFSRKLKDVPEIAGAHHEKIDGTGYPQGLRDKEIPKLSKILAVCDVFDALTSQRPYRDRMSFFKVLHIINRGAGTDFDDFYVAALKKIRLDRILLILEDEHKENLRPGDLRFLSHFTLTDLMFVYAVDEPTPEQQKLVRVFTKYYVQNYEEVR
ncbi:HD domain-containing protein [candidate division KSB1 bacterium]|nr:HD domain-containing protein [candidate division KSB1 bacterium]RQW10774.1 MAG: GAF domain-containing protein [candidate division KSB1 bacterium]